MPRKTTKISRSSFNHFHFILNPFNALLYVGDQFSQEAYFLGLVWKIVRMCFKFTPNQFANRELPSQIFLIWSNIKIIIVHDHNPWFVSGATVVCWY